MKKFIAFLLSFSLVAAQIPVAGATDLNAAMSNLLGGSAAMSTNNPGVYSSGARTGFSGGGLEMRIPADSAPPALFSMTPPSISVGCSGISAYFGGFSFISGAQFQQLIQSIASGAALGFVALLVLKTLCPQCEAIVQALQNIAQEASKLAVNKCQVFQSILSQYQQGKSSTNPSVGECAATASGTGISSDILDALNSVCQGTRTAVTTIDNKINHFDLTTQAGKNANSQNSLQVPQGNLTWLNLGVFDFTNNAGTSAADTSEYDRKVLLMNMLGVRMYPLENGSLPACPDAAASAPVASTAPASAPASSGSAPASSTSGAASAGTNEEYCVPTLNPTQVMQYFMCGWPGGSTTVPVDPAIAEICSSSELPSILSSAPPAAGASGASSSTFGVTNKQIYVCGAGDTQNCNTLVMAPLNSIVKGEGFVPQVYQILMSAVQSIQQGTPMPASALALMQSAPFPLYQAVNAAAVYPEAGVDLIDSLSYIIGEQLAVNLFNQFLTLDNQHPGYQGTFAQSKQILEALQTMRSLVAHRSTELAQNLVIQQELATQIRDINMTIQQKVMSPSLLGDAQFGQALYSNVSPEVQQPSSAGK